MKERPDIFKNFIDQLETVDMLLPEKSIEVAKGVEGMTCPDCGCKTMFKIEDCYKCEACGYAAC